MSALSIVKGAVAARKRLWLLIALGFVFVYYAGLLLSLVIRFGELPNYVTLHDYVRNVIVVVRSTPSLRDMAPIILDQWLLEIGYMNRDYGHGISEWSMEIIPAKFAVVLALGALVATNAVLLERLPPSCAHATRFSGAAATGLGAFLVGFTSITAMWVVCCAAPSWAVGLALLGVGVSTAFGLEPFGTGIALAGFLVLLGATYLLARRSPRAAAPPMAVAPRLAQGNA
jgi:hypothetical protein